ncbi:MAG: alpha-L-fucosidase [Planctomycetes bacterium]|nr:alpha-L-fucosidase [Planctomycetota bacterium]
MVIASPCLIALLLAEPAEPPPPDPRQELERTSFQSAAAYMDAIDIQSDVAMVYGIDPNLPARIETWRKEGYRIHVMTGVAWGNYQDYLSGRWDRVEHDDLAQTDRNGKPILHGPTVPYMVPAESFGRYLCEGVQRAIDAGALAIHLEEPEFWVRGGYSRGFQREWKAFYGDDWIPPHQSPDAQYRASKLKYFLYQRALRIVFSFIDEYGGKIGRDVRCYVPTHSMLNYAHWRIVSPERSLVGIEGCDGYIGQTWTGTARTPNVHEGRLRERTFETAFLEYGVLHNLVRATGRRMWYLNDPVEDNPNHGWDDYRRNWESTLVASLLWPDVWRFEVMPWPNRVFLGRFRRSEKGEARDRIRIPPDYATELLAVTQALNDMDQKEVIWDCGTRGIGILVADTMMFQRGDPGPTDPHLSDFYGLALPLFARGIPVEPVQLENGSLAGYLDPYRVLVLSYEFQKPLEPTHHDALAAWVRAGGVLVYIGDDADPYHAVKEWWTEKGYASARIPLFEALGLAADAAEGAHPVGEGTLIFRRAQPKAFAASPAKAEELRGLVRDAAEAANLAWRETNHIVLRRGPYVIAAGLDESVEGPSTVLEGHFCDLFDAGLAIRRRVEVAPGSRILLIDLDRVGIRAPSVVAAAAKIRGQAREGGRFRFHAEGPAVTTAAVRILLDARPREIRIAGEPAPFAWDQPSRTALIRFPNDPKGVWVEVEEGAAPAAEPPPPGADPSPEERLEARLEWFQDQKFGFMMHWGAYSQWGCIESWPLIEVDTWARPDDLPAWVERGKDIERFKRDYWALDKTFAPAKFDPAAWARAAKDAGMRYVVFTTKHHDGFSMFDTKLTDYRITGPDCPFHSDPRANVTKLIFDAFRAEGFGIGAYFSKADWHSPYYWIPDAPARTRNPNYDTRERPETWKKFVEFVHGQIEELMTGYGPIDILWLDAGQVRPPSQDIDMDRLVAMARGHQRDLIVVDRTVGGKYENYRTPEQEVPETPPPYVWETCMTMGKQWSYKPQDEYKSERTLIHLLVDIVSKGGNFLLNVGPRPDGELPAEALERLAGIARWMRVNGEAIYGTRPLPPYKVGRVALTRRGDVAYAIHLAAEGEEAPPARIEIAGVRPAEGAEVRMFGVDGPLAWRVEGEGLSVDIPAAAIASPPCRHAFAIRIPIR